MLIKEDFVDLETPTGPMRTHRFAPGAGGPYPGVVLFSEIYQVTGPIARLGRWLAGHGYLVAAPEVYHELEPAGTALPYDKEGTERGNRHKVGKELSAYDADARTVIIHLQSLPTCSGRIGALGLCLGGHLALRCAMNPAVQAAVCFYPTDIHQHSLGKGQADNTLERMAQIKGELLLVWGKQDPHIPQEGRDLIYRTLGEAGVNFTWHEFNAAHAFMRDEGPRYNPALAALGHGLTLELFSRRLQHAARELGA